MRAGDLGLRALLALGALSCGQSSERSPVAAPAVSSTPAASVENVDASDPAGRTKRTAGSRPSVIWLGLDGLDWDLLDRLASEGRMPNWKRLTSEGYTARLKSYVPILSPVVWTTLATGVGPDLHRVLDFQEVDPATGRKMPISGALPRRARDLERGLGLGRAGRRRGLVGHAPRRGGQGLLRLGPREPDPLRGARAAGTRLSRVAFGRRRADRGARGPRSRTRS